MSDIKTLLERFRRGPELLAVATTGASNVELDFVPGPGKWTCRQIACHLADAEVVCAQWFRATIAEENPAIIWFDQDAWVANLDYSRRKISDALEMFRVMRHYSFELLKSLPEEAYARKCTHSTDGELTLADLLLIYAEHAEKHSRQIMEARQKYKATPR